MTFENIVQSIPKWLDEDGPESGIVISSRARLARNISGIKYVHRTGQKQLSEVVKLVLDAAVLTGFEPSVFFCNADLGELERTAFIERHLISPHLASKNGERGVLVMEGEKNSILINEEDHLRIQSIGAGFNTETVMDELEKIEGKMSKALKFAFSDTYGYLTACPTNIGTGLRISVLIHLPALVYSKDMPKVMRSAGQLGLAVRGYYGEGTESTGNLFQISNQKSLGKTTAEFADSFSSAVSEIVDYEKKMADTMYSAAKSQLEDKFWRSLGILKSARMLSTNEFMDLCSSVRLGCHLSFLDSGFKSVLNELLVLTQPGHLQERSGCRVDAFERDILRAKLVRERFAAISI